MPRMDFDAAVSAAEREPVAFTIRGQEFQAVPIDELPWMAGMRLAAAPDEGPEAEAALARWFDACLVPGDRVRFQPILQELGIGQLKQLLEWLGQVYSGRPTELPSTSPAGSSPTGALSKGEPRSKVIHLRPMTPQEAEEIEAKAYGVG